MILALLVLLVARISRLDKLTLEQCQFFSLRGVADFKRLVSVLGFGELALQLSTLVVLRRIPGFQALFVSLELRNL